MTDFWKNRNVLVTGGTGLVGAHITEKLLAKGSNVIVAYRNLHPRSYFLTQGFEKQAVMAHCDIKNYQRVLDLVSRYEIEVILHLAAQPLVTVAYHNPLETLETNIMGTVNVLEAARHCPQVCSIVVASSDKAYGRSAVLPYLETHELKGDHPYNVSKSAADMIAQTYYRTYGLPVTVTRFGNVYGPGDLNFNRIIPGAILAMLRGLPLEIRSDGNMLREYVYVKDVAEGCLLLGENIERAKGEAFNFGSGERYRVLELVSRIEEIIGRKITLKILNSAKNEIEEQYLSFGKVQKFFSWKPKYTLETAFPETVKWYSSVLPQKF